jgi:hypothetical protein
LRSTQGDLRRTDSHEPPAQRHRRKPSLPVRRSSSLGQHGQKSRVAHCHLDRFRSLVAWRSQSRSLSSRRECPAQLPCSHGASRGIPGFSVPPPSVRTRPRGGVFFGRPIARTRPLNPRRGPRGRQSLGWAVKRRSPDAMTKGKPPCSSNRAKRARDRFVCSAATAESPRPSARWLIDS